MEGTELESRLAKMRGSGMWMIITMPISPLVYLLAVLPHRNRVRILLASEGSVDQQKEYRREMVAVWVAMGLWIAGVVVMFLMSQG